MAALDFSDNIATEAMCLLSIYQPFFYLRRPEHCEMNQQRRIHSTGAKAMKIQVFALVVTLAVVAQPVCAQVSQEWIARYNGTGNNYDSANAIAVDARGNVYVSGASYGLGTSTDCTTIKYNTSGNKLWVARYNGPSNDRDEASAVTVDAEGNVYITGSSSYSLKDYVTIKYSQADRIAVLNRMLDGSQRLLIFTSPNSFAQEYRTSDSLRLILRQCQQRLQN